MKSELSLVRAIVREMMEATYATRSTFFVNPYEDPGDEFIPDEEDPIGLVNLQNITNKELEIHGRN